MLAPVYQTLSTPAVLALVGAPPRQRIYGFGSTPQGTPAPYITWLTAVGTPYDQLSGPPCGDNDTVQIDCYTGPKDDQAAICVQLAQAVRDALDLAGISYQVVINHREPDTRLFRIGIQADFIRSR